MSNTPVTDRLVEVWDQELEKMQGVADSRWSLLSNDDLYLMEAILWGMHQDAVLEWSRRQMRERDPSR